MLKPVQVPPKGQTEVEFYQEVFGEQASTDKVLLQLRELVPKFHGIVHAPKEPDGKDIHVLEWNIYIYMFRSLIHVFVLKNHLFSTIVSTA